MYRGYPLLQAFLSWKNHVTAKIVHVMVITVHVMANIAHVTADIMHVMADKTVEEAYCHPFTG